MRRNEYVTYSDLKLKYGESKIPYNELLKTIEWYNKREEILKRDKNQCQNCGTYPTPTIYQNGERISRVFARFDGAKFIDDVRVIKLDVHHKVYSNKLPWEYSDEGLITLCTDCHAMEHQ